MGIEFTNADGKTYTFENATGMPAREWHYCYQDGECAEGTIRRMMMWPDGTTKYPDIMWKWSYLKPLLEAAGVVVDAEGYEDFHIDVQGHDMTISPTEGYDVRFDGMDICWEK